MDLLRAERRFFPSSFINTEKAEFRLVLRAPSGGNYKKKKTPALRVVFLAGAGEGAPGLGRGCFPDSSVGKESTYNAGDPDLIPGSGRSAGEGIGYPLQYSWASLVAQLVKYPPAMWETWVQSMDWEDPLEKGKATHSSILAWTIPWTI